MFWINFVEQGGRCGGPPQPIATGLVQGGFASFGFALSKSSVRCTACAFMQFQGIKTGGLTKEGEEKWPRAKTFKT